ncbi:conserved hypothetical protein [Paraburkholderia ribeironis]|uniref:Uncharacterized protein n=1 Tax=Paraburkholderia ribeironis TaxID=1247936 RepID=A0A1N7RPW4_9BURK|nr:conserved hypothetical protein [Paraburkholderia ribeironis]
MTPEPRNHMDMRIMLLSPPSPFDKLSRRPQRACPDQSGQAQAPQTYHNRDGVNASTTSPE